MSTTRQQIIEKTSDLLERQGYYATGLNQIVAESETPRGSLYYYFPEGKEELAAEAVWYKARQMAEHLRQRLDAHTDVIEAIYQFMLEVADHSESQHCTAGAPIAAVALETSANNERLRQACQAAYHLLQKPFAEKLLAAGFMPERAQSLAITVSVALEGAVILGRTERTSQAMRLVAEEIKQLLRAASPAAYTIAQK
jgi:TetR/AcrR family transcriptional repressor of lmrAB and yxaGH operons